MALGLELAIYYFALFLAIGLLMGQFAIMLVSGALIYVCYGLSKTAYFGKINKTRRIGSAGGGK